jgi:hypothetical protein
MSVPSNQLDRIQKYIAALDQLRVIRPYYRFIRTDNEVLVDKALQKYMNISLFHKEHQEEHLLTKQEFDSIKLTHNEAEDAYYKQLREQKKRNIAQKYLDQILSAISEQGKIVTTVEQVEIDLLRSLCEKSTSSLIRPVDPLKYCNTYDKYLERFAEHQNSLYRYLVGIVKVLHESDFECEMPTEVPLREIEISQIDLSRFISLAHKVFSSDEGASASAS